MSGRLTKTKAKLVNGRCYNYVCDARSYCTLYQAPTVDEKKNYPAHPMLFCPLFVDTDPATPRDSEPTRPFLETL